MSLFSSEIHSWYVKHKRDLPWRDTKDAYKIWLSEIMLQQTRVIQATGYYYRFISHFPTVFDLANATEDQILKLWQGLGYYSRARNMHETAKIIVAQYNGIFPNDYQKIRNLKGIGPYTAAAIASIAFDLPYAVVDGNVARVLSRFFGITNAIDVADGKNEVQKIASETLQKNNPGIHNQAIMDFGALQCVPKSPNCGICPLLKYCYAAIHNQTAKLPVKSKKNKPVARYFYFYIIENDNHFFLEKRTGEDIWKNLYQFPLFESDNELSDTQILSVRFPNSNNTVFNIKSISATVKHQLTHQTIFARFIFIESKTFENIENGNFIRVHKKDILTFAVPVLFEPIVKKLSETDV